MLSMRLASRLVEMEHALAEYAPHDPDAMPWFLSELRQLLGAAFAGVYKPIATDGGWGLDFMIGDGADAHAQIRAFRGYVAALPATDRFHGYSPYLVPAELRNRVTSLEELRIIQGGDLVTQVTPALAAVGQHESDQIRVLLCDGPRLLSWVGSTRPEPFTRREAAVLARLTGALQCRFKLEHQLRPAWPRALALEPALAALNRAAFLVGPRGTIEPQNEFAVRALEGDAHAVTEAIRGSRRPGAQDAPFLIVPLSLPGCPSYALAIQKESRPTLADRVALAQRRWGLTARQVCVLEQLAAGAATKVIASELGCAEVTVENHITAIFRRSGARSRADLLRRLFAPAVP